MLEMSPEVSSVTGKAIIGVNGVGTMVFGLAPLFRKPMQIKAQRIGLNILTRTQILTTARIPAHGLCDHSEGLRDLLLGHILS